MKTAILLLVLLCASAVKADTIYVSETTFYEPVFSSPFGVIPVPSGDSVAQWFFTFPAAHDEDSILARLSLIYQVLGINLTGQPYNNENEAAGGQFVGEELEYVTDLPPGISVNGTLDIPSLTTAPEPGTLLLLGSGLLGIGALAARRRRIV